MLVLVVETGNKQLPWQCCEL